jgi:uncharacterized protein YecE (DUF72 family)
VGQSTRYTTNRRVLADAGDSIERFINSGIAELGEKLGPIVWQFAPTKIFDADDFGAFLALLPKKTAHARRSVFIFFINLHKPAVACKLPRRLVISP